MWRVTANILNKQLSTTTSSVIRKVTQRLGLGQVFLERPARLLVRIVYKWAGRCTLTYLAQNRASGALFRIRQWTVGLNKLISVPLDNDQRDAHLLYFTVYLLHSSTCFEHYMPIIRRLNCIDAASGIVLSVNGRPMHRLGEFSPPNLCTGRPLTERTIPDAASIQFNLLMMSI